MFYMLNTESVDVCSTSFLLFTLCIGNAFQFVFYRRSFAYFPTPGCPNVG